MAQRTETIVLTAQVAGYLAGMEKARQATEKTGSEAEKLAAKKEAFNTLSVAALGMGAAIGAGVVLAVSKFAEFDAKMSQVQTLSGATAGDMAKLGDEALHAGQQIGLSATQVADAEIELVKAGTSVKDIMGGALTGALNLAASGQIDVAEATSIATIALTQFNLKGRDIPHVADLLAAGADKALGGVKELGDALKQSGLVASQFGLSIDDTVGTLSAFANAGLLGSDAGTSFKTMLQQLANPSKQSADKMKELGIAAYDAQGSFVGITGLAEQLKEKLSSKNGVTDAARDAALSIIFGSDAVRAANVLYKEGGAGIQDWINKVDDSGFAAQQAAGKMDNLKGDISKLQSAIDTGLIESGSGANDALRGLVQNLTGLANLIGDLPAPVLATSLQVAGVASAALLASGAFLGFIPKLAQFQDAMRTTKLTLPGLVKGLGGVAGAATAVSIAYSVLSEETSKNAAAQSEFQSSLNQTTGAITKATRAAAAKQLADGDAFELAKRVGISQRELTDAVLKGGDAYEVVRKKLAAYTNEKALSDGVNPFAATDQYQTIVRTNDALGKARDNLKDVRAATDAGTDSAEGNAKAFDGIAGSALGAAQNVSELADKIRGFGSAQLDANDATRSFEAAVDAVTESVKDNGTSLDVGTEKGRANSAALDEIAKSALNLAAATYQQSGSQDQAAASIQAGRDQLIASLGQFGITGQAAQDYADKLGLIPANVQTVVKLEKTQAQKDLEAFIAEFNNRTLTLIAKGITEQPGGVIRRASGGYVAGPGTATSDSINARLSNGEYVVNAAATAANRDALDRINYGRRYADGGYVRGGTYPPSVTNDTSSAVTNNNFTINEAVDASATATAIMRRQALLKA